VTLHCCNLEKNYNPYYTLVLNNLCSESYSHRFTLQYALWDLLREGAGTNVAKTMAYIIARGSMDLTVFKVSPAALILRCGQQADRQAIDFTTLKKNMITFFKTLLPSVILATQTTSPLFVLSKQQYDNEVIQDVFEKSLANPELAQGLAYVITRYGAKMGEGLDERQGAVVKKGLEAGKKVLARSL
jgi:nucleolar MIF4G domain-containing protein 1